MTAMPIQVSDHVGALGADALLAVGRAGAERHEPGARRLLAEIVVADHEIRGVLAIGGDARLVGAVNLLADHTIRSAVDYRRHASSSRLVLGVTFSPDPWRPRLGPCRRAPAFRRARSPGPWACANSGTWMSSRYSAWSRPSTSTSGGTRSRFSFFRIFDATQPERKPSGTKVARPDQLPPDRAVDVVQAGRISGGENTDPDHPQEAREAVDRDRADHVVDPHLLLDPVADVDTRPPVTMASRYPSVGA